jgi:hypothetical protein
METSREEGRHHEVDQCPGSHGFPNQQIEHELNDKIGPVPPCELLRSHKPRSERVKENLKGSV